MDVRMHPRTRSARTAAASTWSTSSQLPGTGRLASGSGQVEARGHSDPQTILAWHLN